MIAQPSIAAILLLLCLIAPLQATQIPSLSPKKIVLLHMHDRAPFFEQLGDLTLRNKQRYAARHGYEMAVHVPAGTSGLFKQSSSSCSEGGPGTIRNSECYVPANSRFKNDNRAATFGKIKLARAACVGRDGYWMLWSDADAMIVNQTLPLTHLIDDRYDMMISVDWLMINAGVILFKCSEWTEGFLKRVYDAPEFDEARALDQSALQHYIDTEEETKNHVKYLPKRLINVYVEEYLPGDFLLHMAGKLYEATTAGANAIANQFDVLSTIEDVEDVASFFNSQYLLGKYSGICVPDAENGAEDCSPTDPRRLRLAESLRSMSEPNRYRHVLLRYSWMDDWKDKYDVDGWNEGRVAFEPENDKQGDSRMADSASNDTVDDTGRCAAGVDCEDDHNEL